MKFAPIRIIGDSQRLTTQVMRELLTYNSETGHLYWRYRGVEYFNESAKRSRKWIADAWNKKHAGKQALISDKDNGYKSGRVFGRNVLAHRVAWAIQYGEWPEGDIDHINGDKTDNRLRNLRQATRSQNLMNRGAAPSNTSGVKGVCWDKRRGKWSAKIKVGGKTHNLGRFDAIDDAANAYKAASLKLHGQFSRVDGEQWRRQ